MLAMSRLFVVLLSAWSLCVLGVSAQSVNYTGSTTSYTIPYAASCSNARGMAVDSAGSMYVACGQQPTGSIIVMDSNGNFLRNITQPTSSPWSPFGIVFSGSTMYVTSLWTNQVYQLTTATGAFITSWSTNLYEPWGIALDGSNNVYVANYGANVISKFTSSGSFLRNFSTSNPAMYYPEEIAIDGSGNVYVADTDNNRIVKFDSNGNVKSIWNSTTPQLNEPGGIALDSQGSIYVCDTWNYAVIKLNSAGQQIETLSSPLADGTAKVSAAAGLTVDSNNVVYVVDSLSNNRILKFPATLLPNSASAAASSSILIAAIAAVFAVLIAGQ